MSGLHADLGLTIGVGVVCAVPTIVLAGPVYARWIAPRLDVRPDAELVAQFSDTGEDRPRMSAGLAFTAVLVPVALMLLRTVAEIGLPSASRLREVLTFTGQPVIAMLVGFLFALAMTARHTGDTRAGLTDSLKSIAIIMLIIAGGGAFNEVLEESGIGRAVASAAGGAHLNVLILGWLLALLLSASTGSATVGIVSATGIVAPSPEPAAGWKRHCWSWRSAPGRSG